MNDTAYSAFGGCPFPSYVLIQHNVGEGKDFTITKVPLILSPPRTVCLSSPMLKIEDTASSFVSLLPAMEKAGRTHFE